MGLSVGDAAVTAQGADDAGELKEAHGLSLESTMPAPEAVPPVHGPPP